MEPDKHEVVLVGGKFRVVLVGDELYRDSYGNLKRRRVEKRTFDSFDTPLEAQALAEKWNREDEVA